MRRLSLQSSWLRRRHKALKCVTSTDDTRVWSASAYLLNSTEHSAKHLCLKRVPSFVQACARTMVPVAVALPPPVHSRSSPAQMLHAIKDTIARTKSCTRDTMEDARCCKLLTLGVDAGRRGDVSFPTCMSHGNPTRIDMLMDVISLSLLVVGAAIKTE